MESAQQKHSSDRKRRASPVSEQKLSPKAGKRTRSYSSSDEEQQNVPKNKLSKQQYRASPEQQSKVTDRNRHQGGSSEHRPSRHVDKRRRATPERRQRSSPDRRSALSPDRRRNPSADKYQRRQSSGQRQARFSLEQNQQARTRSRSDSSPSPKQAVGSQDAEHQRESSRVDRRRASSPATAQARRARKASSTSPEPPTASPPVKERQFVLESSKINPSSGIAAELTEAHRASRSESDDEAVKKRRELSGSEEVFSRYFIFALLFISQLVNIFAMQMLEHTNVHINDNDKVNMWVFLFKKGTKCRVQRIVEMVLIF